MFYGVPGAGGISSTILSLACALGALLLGAGERESIEVRMVEPRTVSDRRSRARWNVLLSIGRTCKSVCSDLFYTAVIGY